MTARQRRRKEAVMRRFGLSTRVNQKPPASTRRLSSHHNGER
jgi:hypothetical protein